MDIYSNEQLIDTLDKGETLKYIYFWGHQKSKSSVSKSCFSQWYPSSFEDNGVLFVTAEHYMMYQKAKLFECHDIAEKVIQCENPGAVKKLGREVSNFDEAKWKDCRFDIVVQANQLKFSQNTELAEFLLSTTNRVLVEASPLDRVWGIGLATDDPKIADPRRWQGLNLLGYALMVVRQRLASTSSSA